MALLTVQANRVAGVVIGFWLTPLILRFLDQSEYGLYALAMGAASWLGVCDLGLSAGLQVELSRQWQMRGRLPLVQYVSSAFYGQLALACLIVVLAVGMGGVLPRVLELPVAFALDLQALIVVLGASVAVVVASRTFGAALTAYRRAHIDHLIQFAVAVTRAGLTVWFLTTGHGLLSIAWAHLAGSIVGMLLAFGGSRTGISGFRLSPRQISWPTVRELTGVGFWFSVGGVGGLFILATDRAIAAKLVSLEAVGVLYLTSRLYHLAETLLGPIVNGARPALGELLGQAQREEAGRVYDTLERVGVISACAAAIAVWAGNRAFVTAWVGEQYYGGWMLDATLAAALVANAWVLPKRALLSAARVVRPQALSRLSEGLLNFLLSIVLGRWFGLIGIVASTSLAALPSSCWYLRRLTKKVLGDHGLGGSSLSATRIAVVCALLFSIAVLGRWLAAELGGGYGGAGLAMVVSGLGAAALLWTWAGNRELRSRLRKLIPAIAGA